MGDVLFAFDVNAKPETIHRALTTAEGVAGFWTDDANVPAEVGKTLTLRFPDAPAAFDLVLTQSDDDVISWRTKSFPPPWVGTDIRWEISGGDNASTVAFRHGTFADETARASGVRVGPRHGAAQAVRRDWSRRTSLCQRMKPVDVTTAVNIARPRHVVAAYAADRDHAPDWYGNIERVGWQTERPLTVGTRLDFVARFLGRTLAYTYEVIDFVADERLVMATAEGPFRMETRYTWARRAGGCPSMSTAGTTTE